MPTLEKRQPKQRLSSESGAALAPADLGRSETQAVGNMAAEILKLGDEFSSVGLRLDEIQRNDEYVKGQLAYGEMYSKHLVTQEEDPDYANWPRKYTEAHRQFAEHYLPSMQSSGAQKDMDVWLKNQLNSNSKIIGINAGRHLAASRRASIPGMMNRALADAVAAQTDIQRQAVRDAFKKELGKMVAEGSLFEGAAATDLSEYDRRLIGELVEEVKRKRQKQISAEVTGLNSVYDSVDESSARAAMEQLFATGQYDRSEQLEISRRLEAHIAIKENEKKQADIEREHTIITKLQNNDPTAEQQINELDDPDERMKWWNLHKENQEGDKEADPIIKGNLYLKAMAVSEGDELAQFQDELQRAYRDGSLGRGKPAASNYEELLKTSQTKFDKSHTDVITRGVAQARDLARFIPDIEKEIDQLIAIDVIKSTADIERVRKEMQGIELLTLDNARMAEETIAQYGLNPENHQKSVDEKGKDIDEIVGFYFRLREEGAKRLRQERQQRYDKQNLSAVEAWNVEEKWLREMGTPEEDIQRRKKLYGPSQPQQIDYVRQLDSWMKTQSNIDSLPEDLVTDLQTAMRAVGNGADPKEVFRRILNTYRVSGRPDIQEFLVTLIEPITQ